MSEKTRMSRLFGAIAAISLLAAPSSIVRAQEVSAPKPNANTKSWKNADFNTAVPDSKQSRGIRFKNSKGWEFKDEKELVPAGWRVSSDAVGSYEQDSEGNYFIRLKKGYVTQYFLPQTQEKGVLKISFKARGAGPFTIWTSSFQNKNEPNAKGYDILKKTQKYQKWDLTSEWQTYQFEAETAGVPTERVAIRFTALAKCELLDLDDVFVVNK
ncbi:MAG: hypothetical protein IJJ33_17930 [Victivallales bacterium]|nr:hypothetical protein [Victivallales bacterium]